MTYQVGEEPVPGYRLVSFVGRGNSGDVWKALGPGRVLVALKIIALDSKLGRRERRAILGLRNFNDNALVNIYGLWFKDRAGQILEYSEELEDDLGAFASPPPTSPRTRGPGDATTTGSSSDTGSHTAASHVTAPVRPTHSVKVQSPGYLGRTIDPDAEELASIAETTDPGRSTSATDTSSGSGSGSNIHGSGTPSTDTATGSRGSDIAGSHADGSGSRKSSSQNATELVVAMTLGDMTLGDRLEERQSEGHPGIPLKELQRLMRDAARGIDYLNCRNFQHCDIKPENILIVGSGAKICDFGLARPTQVDPMATQTPNGFTWACAAPEQLQRGKDVQNFSAHTDQYSLATAYYRLRTGKFPFDENDINDLIRRKREGKLDLSSKVLEKRERVALAKALELQPTARYASAADFVEALEQAVAPDKGNSWRTFTIGAAIAALLVCGVIGGYLAWREYVPSLAYSTLANCVAANDFAGASAAFQTLDRDRERRKAAELLLDKLAARRGQLGADQCAQLDKLLQDSAVVVATLDGPAQDRAVELLDQLETQRSQAIPAAIRQQLGNFLDQQAFVAARQWQLELPQATECDLAVRAFARDEILRKWLSHSEREADGEQAIAVLENWPQLAEQVRDARRDDYQERLDKLKRTAISATRKRALTVLASGSQSDWQASRPYWEALVRHSDETQPDAASDKLAAIMSACAVDMSSASEQVQNSLAELDAQTTPTTQRPARLQLLAAMLVAHDLTREKPIHATSVERLLDLLLLVKNAPVDTQSLPLTVWERSQNDTITASLDDYVAALTAEQQTAILPKLEKVKAGAGVNLRLAQIRREISEGHIAPARELLSKTQSDFAQDSRVQPQVATLRLWIDLNDSKSDFTQVLPSVAKALLEPSPTDPEAPLSASLLARVEAAGAASSELASAIDVFARLHADSKSPTTEFEQTLARLLNLRLEASLRAATIPETLARDATLLLSLPAKASSDHKMLPTPLVAAAAIESQLSTGKVATNAAHWNELLTRCKQPLTSQQQAAWPWAANYPAWVLLRVAASEGQLPGVDAIRMIYTGLPDDSMLKTPDRRGQTARLIWNSFPNDALPNDRQIPWANPAEDLAKLVAELTIARALATDSTLATAEQARIAAALAIVDYYTSVANKTPLTKSLAMADATLSQADLTDALAGDESAPGMLQHLLYVRARASLAMIGATPVAEQDRERLVRQAAEAVEASFDFIGFQRATEAEAQDAADIDLYFAVVQPALRIAGQTSPANLQPALAILHAAQARIVERSTGVRGKLLRENGIKVDGLFALRRDSYARAAEWEKRPDVIVRNCLHQAAALLDWHGSRAVEVRQQLPDIIARAKDANPEAHGTHYLQGMEHLFLSRDEGLDLCNIAKSAAKQRAELDLAEQTLQKALSSPSLTKAENAEYRPRYYVGLSAVNLERAFIRATVDEKVPILLQAREQAIAAIAAASEHPLKSFLDQAYIAEGNAYEDLALHCDRKQHFNDSEQSFKNGQAAAGAGWLQSEASFHLGRCQLRNALRTIPRQDGEKLIAKLNEAEASLLDARDNLPKLEKPHLLGYAIEANIHLAGVYMELAEFYAGRKDGPQAAALIVKADQAYLEAVTGAAEHAPTAWGDYQATWIRRASKRLRTQRLQDAPEAAETRKLVDRLATELLEVATQPTAHRPITADQRALAVQALMDTQESKNTAPLITELRGGRIPRNLTAAQVAEIKTVLEAKQRVLAAKLAVFGNSTCDDMTMAALGLLFDLHQQCSRLPQFTGVRGYCSDTVNKVADRLQTTDWKQHYAKSMAIGFRGLAGADPLLIGLTRDQRKAKTAEFKIAIANLLQATSDLTKLAGQNPELVDKGLIDEGKSTAAFRLTLAELVLEVNDFVPPPARDAATKQLATQAKSLLQESLGRPALVKHQKVIESALDQLDSFLE